MHRVDGRRPRDGLEAIELDVGLLHTHRAVYGELFSDRERFELLLSGGGAIFDVLRDVLLTDIVLGLARLVDPAEMGRAGKLKNCSLLWLPELVATACADPDLTYVPRHDPDFPSEIAAMVEEARRSCEFAVTWRHKRIAHRDRSIALGTAGESLPPLDFADIDKGLSKAADVVNVVQQYFCGGARTAFDVNFFTADALLYFLRRGIEAMEADGLSVLPQTDP